MPNLPLKVQSVNYLSNQHAPVCAARAFAQAPHSKPEWEKVALLGLNFLTDNYLDLHLEGSSGSLAAVLTYP
jgi:hypothetical protein